MQYCRRTPVIVRVWENDFGLPSIDPECLQIMLICRIALIDVKFKKANLPFYRSIPSIEYNTRVITEIKDIILELQVLCHGAPDCFIDTKERGRIMVFKKYFIHKFVPAFFYDCWINPINYEYTMRHWYIKAMMYPFGYLYAHYRNIQARTRFNTMVGSRNTEKTILKLYLDAECCLRDVASVLSKNKYQFFLGKDPSTIDTLIYSYLAVALKLPLPETYLQNMIKEHPVLIDYVDRITKQYFPDIKKTRKYIEMEDNTLDSASTKTLIIAGLCVTTVMVTYAWNLGLLASVWVPSMTDISHLYKQLLILIEILKYPQFSIDF